MFEGLKKKLRTPDYQRKEAGVAEWLAGGRAVQDGTLDMFFARTGEKTGYTVTPDTAEGFLETCQTAFGEQFPELFEDAQPPSTQ